MSVASHVIPVPSGSASAISSPNENSESKYVLAPSTAIRLRSECVRVCELTFKVCTCPRKKSRVTVKSETKERGTEKMHRNKN